ncbi:MAG: hypothetical protein WA705_07355 [Candidatus Ozemobacteraceae bacterium]
MLDIGIINAGNSASGQARLICPDLVIANGGLFFIGGPEQYHAGSIFQRHFVFLTKGTKDTKLTERLSKKTIVNLFSVFTVRSVRNYIVVLNYPYCTVPVPEERPFPVLGHPKKGKLHEETPFL